MTDSSIDHRQLLLDWVAAGVGTEAARVLTTDDFVMHVGASVAARYLEGRRKLRYSDGGLAELMAVAANIYQLGTTSSDRQFVIASDDFVCMQTTFRATAHNGRAYENTYVLTARVRDGRLAEVWEHLDTAYANAVMWGDA